MLSSKDFSYYIISLGCSKNYVESEKINGAMASVGFEVAPALDDASIIIINTCGFIQPAKEESIEIIFDSLNLKEEGKKIAVLGCLSQRYFDEVKKDIPEIDLVYGLFDSNFVATLCSAFHIECSSPTVQKRKPLVNNSPYSYIKISEGCSHNCSYCAIPLIKGKQVSFPMDMVYKDAQLAADNGAKELIIVGQDITAYKYKDIRLRHIVDELSRIDRIEWIRLMYCHPDNLTEETISLIAENDKVVAYIDLPFQHVSKKILQSMGRQGDYRVYLEIVKKLRERVPSISIRSTFMVGYPGEEDDDFAELMNFIKEAHLDRVGCFTYSDEENTMAAHMKHKIDESVKQKRFDSLMETQKEISIDNLKKKIGMTVNVLIEGTVDEETYFGRTEFDAPEVDGIFYLTSKNQPVNSIVKAVVKDTLEYDLIGEIS